MRERQQKMNGENAEKAEKMAAPKRLVLSGPKTSMNTVLSAAAELRGDLLRDSLFVTVERQCQPAAQIFLGNSSQPESQALLCVLREVGVLDLLLNEVCVLVPLQEVPLSLRG